MVTAINTAAITSITATPTPAAAAGEPGAFARELDRAARPEDGEASAEAANESAAPPASNPTAKPRSVAESKSAERKPERSSTRASETGDRTKAEATKDKTANDGNTAPNDLQALLAGLMAQLPAPHATQLAPAATAAADRGDATEATGGGNGRNGGALIGEPPGALVLADAAAAAASGAATPPAFSLPQAASALTAPAEPPPAAPVHQAQVSAAVGTPEFAPGLSAEVTVMLRDGLQEARLQLNPAEMGPITVQIQIEGSNAQINLSAEQAPTRDALEQALPMLAGTLQDSGLTLTGGGVFEQPRQPRDETAPPGAARPSGGVGGEAGGAEPTSAAVRRLAPRGAVDLYA